MNQILVLIVLHIVRLDKDPIVLESSLSRSAKREKKDRDQDRKYEQYHNFCLSIASLKAHQVRRKIHTFVDVMDDVKSADEVYG